MILQPARFCNSCHHQLCPAIDYTPMHQDDQGLDCGSAEVIVVLSSAASRAARGSRTLCTPVTGPPGVTTVASAGRQMAKPQPTPRAA